MNRLFSAVTLGMLALILACGQQAPTATQMGDASPRNDIAALTEQIASGPHDKVASSDGSAELLIPQGGLPEGTTASQVRVAPLTLSGMPVQFKDGSPASGYRLEPDGLTFSRPAVLRMKHSPVDGTLPVVLLLASGKPPEVLNPSMEVDRQTSASTVSVAVSHFSQAVLGRGFYRIEFLNPGDWNVGDKFTAENLTSLLTSSIEWTFEHRQWRMEVEQPLTYGQWRTEQGKVSPELILVPPASLAQASLSGGAITDRQSFTCTGAGHERLVRWTTIRHKLYFVHPDGSRHESTNPSDAHEYGAIGQHMECLVGPTRTPTPTVTPAPAQAGQQMLRLANGHYPISQFRIAEPDTCPVQHWHAATNRPVYGLADGTTTEIVSMTDPARSECGFGRVSDVPVTVLRLSQAQQDALSAAMAQ